MKLQDFLKSKPTDQEKTEHILLLSWAWCDHEDKSTEFMLQYMTDMAEIDYDEVVDFITADDAEEKKSKFYETYPTWVKDLEEMA